MDIFNINKRGPVNDRVNLRRVHLNTLGGNNQAEVGDFCNVEGIFSNIDLQSRIDKFLEDSLYIDLILCFVIAIDQDIIQVYCNEVIQLLLKSVVNIVLEGGRSII